MFLAWSGSVLSAKRITRRDLIPFAVVGAVVLGIYAVGAAVYARTSSTPLPPATARSGAVFAMISTLFCVMVALVGRAAAGREIREELDRIRRGEMPAENEVRRQWDEVTAQARSRWEVVRVKVQERRSRRRVP